MRSYGHYCGLARALDVIGDRWTLLIVRELLARGPLRYKDLEHGLPGIASNMLVNRLREMDAAGLVIREDAPPPVGATIFRLSERGRALEDVISALGRWAGPLMGEARDDETRTHWYALPIRMYFEDASPSRAPATIALSVGENDSLLVEMAGGEIQTRVGSTKEANDADVAIEGSPDLIMALLSGKLSPAAAARRGVGISGDRSVLKRIRRR